MATSGGSSKPIFQVLTLFPPSVWC